MVSQAMVASALWIWITLDSLSVPGVQCRSQGQDQVADPMDYTMEDHAGIQMARMCSGEVAAICADLQRIFQATIDELERRRCE